MKKKKFIIILIIILVLILGGLLFYVFSGYNKKDQYLKRRFGKPRFCMKKAAVLLNDVRLYSQVCSEEYKKRYSKSFSEINRQKAEESLKAKRKPK